MSEMVRDVVLESQLSKQQQLREAIQKDAERITDKAGNPTGQDILVGVLDGEVHELSEAEEKETNGP